MDKNETKNTVDVALLSNELTYQGYLFNKDQMRKFFHDLTIPEYIALRIISKQSEEPDIYSGRTYLKDLAEKLQCTIRQASEMAGALKDRGLAIWAHDGDGSEGTYVTITEAGEKMLSEEESNLKCYYENVIQKFGKDNLIQLLRLMKQLQTIITAEAEEMRESDE